MRCLDRAPEECDVLCGRHAGVSTDAANLDAIADAQIRESGAPDENFRRSVDRSAKSVVLRRHGVGNDRDLSVLVTIGSNGELSAAFVDIGDGADDAATHTFANIGTCPPLATRLSESGDSD